MSYVDGYVIPVANDKKDDYIKMAKAMAPIFKENGALKVTECWGNEVPDGEVTSFPMSVKLKENESVVFSWIEWPSKAVRDTGLKSAMSDKRMKPYEKEMPFDGKRMIFGGFDVVVSD